MVLWEVFLDWVEEGFGEVGLYIFAVLGVKPDDVSFSIPFCGCGCVFLQQYFQTMQPLNEKLHILKANKACNLNKTNELISKCHHENKKYFLMNIDLKLQ